jgi:hypothetical protein
LAGSPFAHLLEGLVKTADRSEAGLERDTRDVQVGGDQEVLRLADAEQVFNVIA